MVRKRKCEDCSFCAACIAKAINVQGYSRGEIIKKQSIPEQNRLRVTTMFADRSVTRNADVIS